MELYKQYVELEKQIEVLEAKKELLRSDIARQLPEDGYEEEDGTAKAEESKQLTISVK